MAKSPRRYSIYALCDPRPEYQGPEFALWGVKGVRHVGQTFKSINHRFREHLSGDSNPYKRNWIRSLQKQGLEPGLVGLVSNIATHEEADRIEIERIAELRKHIGKKALNLTDGGQGGYYSEEQMEESRTRSLGGPNGYERPGNTPYPTLRDHVCQSVREQMMVTGSRRVQEIDYAVQRSTLRQLSTIQTGTKGYLEAYRCGLSSAPLPPGKLVAEAGYLHGRLVAAGYADPLDPGSAEEAP